MKKTSISFEEFEKQRAAQKEMAIEGELIPYEGDYSTEYEGDSEYFTYRTNRFSDNCNTKKYVLNETDEEIAKWFLFTKTRDIFFMNPMTRICEKVEQDLKGKVSTEWLKDRILVEPELMKLLQSRLAYGEETEVSADTWNKSELIDLLPVLSNYFPLFCRLNADGVCYSGINRFKLVEQEQQKKKEPVQSCKGRIRLITKTRDLFELLANSLVFYKTDKNTIPSADCIASYTDKPDVPAFHRFIPPKINEQDNTHFVTNWLRKRLDENSIDVLKAWIWSVYNAHNNSRQALYVYDSDGHAGKSVFFNAVFDELRKNDLVFSCDATSFKSNFDSEAYYNKRLMLIGDNKDRNFIRYGKLHVLTGGDGIKVEGKCKKAFSYVPSLKICAMGNILPEIDTYARHEATRLLIINWKLNEDAEQEMAIKDENGKPKHNKLGIIKLAGDATMCDKLKDHMPEFLHECKIAYDKLCINDCTIDDSSIAEETADMLFMKESVYDDFFDTYFVFTGDKNDKLSTTKLTDTWITYYNENRDRIDDAGLPKQSSNMLEHIIKRFGLKQKDLKPNKSSWQGPRTKGFTGVLTKEEFNEKPRIAEPITAEPITVETSVKQQQTEYVPPNDKFQCEETTIFDNGDDSFFRQMEEAE